MKQDLVRNIITRGIAITYFFAFFSFYIQIYELWSSDGVLPVDWYIKRVGKQLQKDSVFERYMKFPTLLWFLKDSDYFLKISALLGTSLSFVMTFGFMVNSVSFAILYVLYLSLFHVGQTFMSFQWDILLLEAGFLTIFLAPLPQTSSKTIGPIANSSLILMRWLTFRLMFASGVVKLLSGCPTWWSLTALNHHFASQPLPHGLSWLFHQLPPLIKAYGVVFTYVDEMILPFFYFAPWRSVRQMAGAINIMFMLNIIVSGNYNFFNFLTQVITLSVFEDDIFITICPDFILRWTRIPQPEKGRSVNYKWESMGFAFCLTAILEVYRRLFPHYMVEEHKVNFTLSWMKTQLNDGILVESSLILISIVSIYHFYLHMKFWRPIQTITGLGLIISVAWMSTPQFLQSIEASPAVLSPPKTFDTLRPFMITNTYGLFRRMTGVGGRPELIVKGSLGGKNWKEYSFHSKPGLPHVAPPIVMPHQPRFDWQIWFSALGNPQHQFYLVHFIYKLLDGQTSANSLLSKNPFQSKPPLFIKVDKYTYHFTDLDSSHIGADWHPKYWWTRKDMKEYLPKLSKQQLSDFILQNDLTSNQAPKSIKVQSINDILVVAGLLFTLTNLIQFKYNY